MITYRAWIDSDVIGQWSSVEAAHKAVLEYIEQNPEDCSVLHFGAFKSSRATGQQSLYHFFGKEQIQEHIGIDVE